jgi:hypothetical protein
MQGSGSRLAPGDIMKVQGRLVGIVIVFVGCITAHASDADEALSKLEHWKPVYTWTQMSEWSETIRAQTTVGDRSVWVRLSAVVNNPGLPRYVRAEALTLACALADRDIASEIVSRVSLLASSAERTRHSIDDRRFLIHAFVSRGIDNVERVTADHVPIIAFLKTVARSDAVAVSALDELAESPAPIEMRRAAALEIVARKPTLGGGGFPQALRTLLDESSYPTLRDLVRATTGPDDFHYVAAGTLAHFGDKELLPVLDGLRERFANEQGFKRIFDIYVWKINVQDPPSDLLECIAAADPMIDPPKWCIDRGVEFAARVKPDARGIRRGLRSIKKTGLRLGVLEPEDLPDVPIRRIMD